MGPPHWMLVCPDFSDRDVYEELGWVKQVKKDIESRDGNRYLVAVGSAPLDQKIGTMTVYYNDASGLYASVFNLFDQGDIFIDWSMEDPQRKGSLLGLAGSALFIENRWIVKKLDERFSWTFGSRVIPGKSMIIRATLEFYKIIGKKKKVICSTTVLRDDE